jgi:hypothetical protein
MGHSPTRSTGRTRRPAPGIGMRYALAATAPLPRHDSALAINRMATSNPPPRRAGRGHATDKGHPPTANIPPRSLFPPLR